MTVRTDIEVVQFIRFERTVGRRMSGAKWTWCNLSGLNVLEIYGLVFFKTVNYDLFSLAVSER